MVLYRLKDFDPDYQDTASRDDIVGLMFTQTRMMRRSAVSRVSSLMKQVVSGI